jgi:GH25 family lysozyme M1 (1,4-beta-N-acetylmuramidase)
MASNVIMIDPNSANINNNMVNAIPQYQDMFIYAELLATSRGRTVIVNGTEEKTGLEETIKVNFMGVDQNKGVIDPATNEFMGNPNYLNFTTNYYDGSTGENQKFESFGISSIKITINSSFVPQVNIQFVDIRGLSFFNQERSPYRILFNFPPPIFDLTVKGYYGKALRYKLHLVKYTSEFQADSGNFVIDANFIAITYAPLTDIPFRYAVNVPLIDNNESLSSLKTNPPRNTFELILKLQDLYTTTQDQINNSNEVKEYEINKVKIEKIEDAIVALRDYKDVFTEFKNLTMQKRIPDETTKKWIFSNTNLTEYNEIIRSLHADGYPPDMETKLTLVIYPSNTPDNLEIAKTTFGKIKSRLVNTFTSSDIGLTESILESDVSDPTIRNLDNDKVLMFIDVTKYYLKLNKNLSALKQNMDVLSQTITVDINNTVYGKLGMQPTIYNIFKIICDDVDTFFNKMYSVAKDAEEHHNSADIKKMIVNHGNYNDVGKGKTDSHLFSFPLVINRIESCGAKREERVAPIEMSKKCTKPFPEITFVEGFVKSFFTQAQLEFQNMLRGEKNADGSNIWLPISPIDAEIVSDSSSPYIFKNNMNEILQVVMQRFYMISQYVIPTLFYSNNANDKIYLDLYAESEAVNLVSSLGTMKEVNIGENLKGKNVKDLSNKYFTNVQNFYNDLAKLPEYTFSEQSIPVDTRHSAYTDKYNPGFEGVMILDEDTSIEKQVIKEDNVGPVGKFLKESKSRQHKRDSTKYYDFTQDNLEYLVDRKTSKKSGDLTGIEEETTGTDVDTRFLQEDYISVYVDDEDLSKITGNKVLSGITTVGGYPVITKVKVNALKGFTDIVEVWKHNIRSYGESIKNTVFNPQNDTENIISALVLLSNFGNAMSPFNLYQKNLNGFVFSKPGIVETPNFLALYVGAVIYAKGGGYDTAVYNYFKTGEGNIFPNRGASILADMADCDKYLSENDKIEFRQYFEFFYNDFDNYVAKVNEMYSKYAADEKEKTLKKLLDESENGNEDNYFNDIIEPLIKRINLAVYSQLTFKMDTEYLPHYSSIKALNESTLKTANDSFFKQFFKKVYDEIGDVEEKTKKEEKDNEKKRGDKDIVTQTYYSFKNINDKWVNIPTKTTSDGGTYGYPFNREGKRLIDSFVFVDRAMNPIGDTMINAEILMEMFDDPNISVFSVLSQLLSLNGFEFFPLQNFMINQYSPTGNDSNTKKDSGYNEWEESFKIDTSGVVSDRATFVCMYIGGTSSYPTHNGNDFEDDGIENLESTDAGDFHSSDCSEPKTDFDNQENNNKDFPYRQVKAFKVRFGEQNQSMFTNIKIDSKEYPETNESIQILSRLAGDNKQQAPIPKGQNLYNLYENRSYKATVEGLGNVMIQPTQYFQLENVPIFNGAYVILSVEHNIVPNKMTTSFSGTKILKFPVPRVLEASALMGYDFGYSNATGRGAMSAGDVVATAQAITMSQARLNDLNSVYGIDISHWQGNINWNKLMVADNPEDFPIPKFVLIKATQGTEGMDEMRMKHAKGAKSVGLKISYYHFARPYIGTEVETDAKNQASHFLNEVKNLADAGYKPSLPLGLDFEDNPTYNQEWGANKTNNDLWINTFISELKKAGYDAFLYGGSVIRERTSGNFSVPLWYSRYLPDPEMSKPATPIKGWKDWTVWQFSAGGRFNGNTCNFDLNAMKKNFFDSYPLVT